MKSNLTSTSMALTDVYNNVSNALDIKEFAIGIFLDLSKAFDTVNHEILLNKLSNYYIRGCLLSLSESYSSNSLIDTSKSAVAIITRISNRLQLVYRKDLSILGPLLFNNFINDITSSSNLLHFIVCR
jgi:hypothetical protein